ncbi:hypothetical protein NIES593_04385 [Hydrococcus rivularis NIES-593]|uniref:Ice-binding protein C-terminal domain-containing protein n=1 Tax=Hydrococcus rivularis NIES-593 TaxID=1921803 RepID=A0A1U7HPQ2_9CYAN|nr:PEP-CTERM sorting domain-containing protein [Hydrococcus rivularis]OKH25580.1 hypothetical protein NIES593_04385 [Hydrococcus rivularis NIES-593]
MKFRNALACVGVMAGTYFVLSATSAQAAIISSGTYKLKNHPVGAFQPPAYGLRLDGLLTRNTFVAGGATYSNEIYTFDFENSQSEMFLTYDEGAKTIRIFGKAFGGEDIGGTNPSDPNNGYKSGTAAVWNIDFTYKNVTQVLGDDDLEVTGLSKESSYTVGSGTISSSLGTFNLSSQADESGLFFRLGNENDDLGHRGFSGISGWGWINHVKDDPHQTQPNYTDHHIAASDWIFTVGPKVSVPEPTSILSLLAIGTLGAGSLRKKKQDA